MTVNIYQMQSAQFTTKCVKIIRQRFIYQSFGGYISGSNIIAHRMASTRFVAILSAIVTVTQGHMFNNNIRCGYIKYNFSY